jgi:hypothetical protein
MLGYSEKHPTTLEFKLDALCPLKDQKVGNCTLVGSQTALWTYLVMKEIKKMKPDLLAENRTVAEIEVAEFVDNFQAKAFEVFMQMYHLERYLGVRLLRPSDTVEAIERRVDENIDPIAEKVLMKIAKNLKKLTARPQIEKNENFKHFVAKIESGLNVLEHS